MERCTPPFFLERSGPRSVRAHAGVTVTLPCRLRVVPRDYRLKWVKLGRSPREDIALMADSRRERARGNFAARAALPRADRHDLSLRLRDLRLEDSGSYKCELINGVDDDSVTVELRLDGVVFPYQANKGRYQFTYYQAVQACKEQDAQLATFQQLFEEWQKGLDWCNAGWLEDGTVHYPVAVSREPCGGKNLPPGIRTYGARDKQRDRFDAFCFISTIKGSVYFRRESAMFDYVGGTSACRRDGATVAKVGQVYSAWRFSGLNHCEPGWLADGSVRYPIVSPRSRCGGPQPGVRSLGFPRLSHRAYGVYCYKPR